MLISNPWREAVCRSSRRAIKREIEGPNDSLLFRHDFQ